MLNDIMDAVTGKLDELFPECTIYTDEVEQDLQEPCFFVSFLEPSETPMLGQRYFRSTGVGIIYLPKGSGAVSRELARVSDRLMDGMEYIRMPDDSLLRGTHMKGNVSDGVLNFFVNYNMFVIKEKEQEEAMEILDVKGVII